MKNGILLLFSLFVLTSCSSEIKTKYYGSYINKAYLEELYRTHSHTEALRMKKSWQLEISIHKIVYEQNFHEGHRLKENEIKDIDISKIGNGIIKNKDGIDFIKTNLGKEINDGDPLGVFIVNCIFNKISKNKNGDDVYIEKDGKINIGSLKWSFVFDKLNHSDEFDELWDGEDTFIGMKYVDQTIRLFNIVYDVDKDGYDIFKQGSDIDILK